MSYSQMITNEIGEPLGTETFYDDEPGYWDEDYEDEAGDSNYPETDLGDEYAE